MKELNSLLKKLSIQQVGRLRILGNPMPTNEPEEARAHLVYKAVLDGKVTDDTSCASLLNLEESNRYFVRFKREFYFKTLDMFIFLNPTTKEINEGARIGMVAFNKCIAIMYLWETGKKEMAARKANKLLDKYKKLHSVMLNLRLTEMLKDYYLYHEPDKVQFRKFKLLYRKYRDINHAHKYAFYCILKVNILMTTCNVYGKEEMSYCNNLLQTLEDKYSIIPFKSAYYKELFRAKLLIYQITKTSEEIISFCIDLIENININDEKVYFVLLNRLRETIFLHSIKLGDLDVAYYYLNECKIKNHDKTRIIYLEIYYNFFIKDYAEAYRKFKSIYGLDLTKRKDYFEHLQIYKMWFHLLYKMDKIETTLDVSIVRNVNVLTFINNINLNFKDKIGINAQVIIIECCYYIVHHKYELLYDRNEALKKYFRRYFKNNSSRTSIMLHMLINISKHIFIGENLAPYLLNALKELEEYESDKTVVLIDFEKFSYQTIITDLIVPNMPKPS